MDKTISEIVLIVPGLCTAACCGVGSLFLLGDKAPQAHVWGIGMVGAGWWLLVLRLPRR